MRTGKNLPDKSFYRIGKEPVVLKLKAFSLSAFIMPLLSSGR